MINKASTLARNLQQTSDQPTTFCWLRVLKLWLVLCG
jgi:hypothetical protein